MSQHYYTPGHLVQSILKLLFQRTQKNQKLELGICQTLNVARSCHRFGKIQRFVQHVRCDARCFWGLGVR